VTIHHLLQPPKLNNLSDLSLYPHCLAAVSLFIQRPVSTIKYGVPGHCSRNTVAHLRSHVPEFIGPENWPPNSTDINLVDYSVRRRCKYGVSLHNFRHWPAETTDNRVGLSWARTHTERLISCRKVIIVIKTNDAHAEFCHVLTRKLMHGWWKAMHCNTSRNLPLNNST